MQLNVADTIEIRDLIACIYMESAKRVFFLIDDGERKKLKIHIYLPVSSFFPEPFIYVQEKVSNAVVIFVCGSYLK